MPLIFATVFVVVFGLVAMVLYATQSQTAQPERIRATLASALKTSRVASQEEIVDVRKDSSLSSIGWLHQILVKIDAAVRLQRLLDQADLKWNPARLLLTAVAAWIIGAFVLNLRMGTGPISVILTMPMAFLPFIYVLRKRAARFNKFEKAMPDALDLMVSGLRAGHSLIGVLGLVASEAPEPIRREFKLCFEEQNFGLDLRTAMDNLMQRVPLPDLRIVSTAILIQKESGGNLAEVLEKTGFVIRERFRLRDEIRIHTAQSRLTGAILAIMPLALGCILYVQNPAYMSLLFTRPAGHKMLFAGAFLNTCGLLLIRKIVRIKI